MSSGKRSRYRILLRSILIFLGYDYGLGIWIWGDGKSIKIVVWRSNCG